MYLHHVEIALHVVAVTEDILDRPSQALAIVSEFRVNCARPSSKVRRSIFVEALQMAETPFLWLMKKWNALPVGSAGMLASSLPLPTSLPSGILAGWFAYPP